MIQSGLEPVLHVLVGYRADEDQISRPAVVLASVHVLYASDWGGCKPFVEHDLPAPVPTSDGGSANLTEMVGGSLSGC